jgi:hypothetical protein
MEVSGQLLKTAALLVPPGILPGTHWRLSCPRACLDAVEKGNISCPCRELNLSRPARILVATETDTSQLPQPTYETDIQFSLAVISRLYSVPFN